MTQTNFHHPPSLHIDFTGDVMLGRGVNEFLQKLPPEYVWGDMLEEIKSQDLRMINLECALTKYEKTLPKVFHFKSDPQHIESLKKAHIDVVTLANNHTLDFCFEGLKDTLDSLKKEHIHFVGAGEDESKAYAPLIFSKSGLKIAVLGCTDNEPSWRATKDRPGVAYINLQEISAIEDHIRKIKSEVDLLIVSLHVGPNMHEVPFEEYVMAAHKLIDNGVHIIHGHSSHIFQGIEVYKGGLIMYDTGDFIDDYAVDPFLRNDLSLFFKVEATKNKVLGLHLTPVKISFCQVNRALGQEKEWIETRMQLLSGKFGTTFCKTETGLFLEVK